MKRGPGVGAGGGTMLKMILTHVRTFLNVSTTLQQEVI